MNSGPGSLTRAAPPVCCRKERIELHLHSASYKTNPTTPVGIGRNSQYFGYSETRGRRSLRAPARASLVSLRIGEVCSQDAFFLAVFGPPKKGTSVVPPRLVLGSLKRTLFLAMPTLLAITKLVWLLNSFWSLLLRPRTQLTAQNAQQVKNTKGKNHPPKWDKERFQDPHQIETEVSEKLQSSNFASG